MYPATQKLTVLQRAFKAQYLKYAKGKPKHILLTSDLKSDFMPNSKLII